jgi:hypothetical protein
LASIMALAPSLLLLYDAKASHCLKDKGFKSLGAYSAGPKVAKVSTPRLSNSQKAILMKKRIKRIQPKKCVTDRRRSLSFHSNKYLSLIESPLVLEGRAEVLHPSHRIDAIRYAMRLPSREYLKRELRGAIGTPF